MKRSAARGAGLMTAALVALSAVVLSARTHAPNAFESGYFYLALSLDAPELCDKISRDTVEHGPLFGDWNRSIRYLQSMCFDNLAIQRHDLSLCGRVRTISTLFRDGSGISEANCRTRVAAGQSSSGGNHATGMLLGVMGFGDEEIRRAYPDHPAPDRSFEFLQRVKSETGRLDLTTRLARLPDFSRGDAVATRQLYDAIPQCASRRSTSFECRRLRCGLVRAQAGDLACERALERERNPWQ